MAWRSTSVRGVRDIGSAVARRLFIAGYAVVGAYLNGYTSEEVDSLGKWTLTAAHRPDKYVALGSG